MGAKNFTGVRKVKRGGKPRLIIDFRYTDASGKRARFRRVASVQAHEAALAEARRLMKNAADTGVPESPAEPATAALTFRSFVEGSFRELYMPRYRPSTRERYAALFRQSVLEFFGHLELDRVDGTRLRAFAAQLSSRGVQVKGAVNLVRTVLRAANECGALPRLPELPRLVKATRKLPDTFTEEELATLVDGSDGWLGTLIRLSAHAGLRMGEGLALEVGDVDLDHGLLLVRRALSAGEVLTPKSVDERVVPLTLELAAHLGDAVAAKAPDACVVLNDRSLTPARQDVLARFKRLERKLGLKERSFHALRHSFLSRLVRRGASVEAVRVLAGHSSLTVTERYVHATGNDLRHAIDLLR